MSRLSSRRPDDAVDETSDEIDLTDVEIPISSAAEEEDEEEEEDLKPQTKKRKPKKVVPIGRNGLKKRRVMKSRTTTDSKGYMRTCTIHSQAINALSNEVSSQKRKTILLMNPSVKRNPCLRMRRSRKVRKRQKRR